MSFTTKIEMEFSGAGAGWTDVSADVLAYDGIVADYGIHGSGPLDRVAGIGTITFSLRNSTLCSGGVAGYYSPNNANCRSGFGIGIGIRFSHSYNGGASYYRFVGRLDMVNPVPGIRGPRLTKCAGVDFMDEASRYKIKNIPTQINKRSDQVFSTVLANMPVSPAATSIATGKSTFAYSLDNVQDDQTYITRAWADIALSELALIYVRGSAATGGVLTFESRTTRAATTTVALALTDNLIPVDGGLNPKRSRADVLNSIFVKVHGRRVDPAATTQIYSLTAASSNIVPGNSITLQCAYRDPTGRFARIGAVNVQALVSGVDYKFTQNADGTGFDYSSSFSLVSTLGGNQAQLVFTNNGTHDAYLTTVNIYGQGVYDYEVLLAQAIDSSSQQAIGPNELTIDMTLQNDFGVGQGFADYILHLYDSPLTYVDSIEIFGNINATLMAALAAIDISDRITISETISGLSSSAYYVNAIRMTVNNNRMSRVRYTLAPADQFAYWLLGIVGSSELGTTTRLAYV